jgi:hypothetical protein
MMFLRKGEIVQDTSGLRASNLGTEDALYRKTVEPERVRAAPGKGLPEQDIVGVLFNGYNRTGYSGLEFKEDIYVLMRDGWAYTRTDLPPTDLDVQASRKLEPQQWVRWERAGDKYRFRQQDDRGRLAKDWDTVSCLNVRPWQADQRLNATYMVGHFYGNLGTFSTSTKNFITFKSDGTFETVSSSLSASGVLPALNGFNSGASSYADKNGSRSSAGGGNEGVFASSSQSRKGDGADRRGHYRFNGYTLELQYDSGQTGRLMSFSWGGDLKHVFLHGETYSLAKD